MISQKLLYTQPISSQNFSLRNMISKSRLKKYFNFVQFFIVDILIKQSFNNSHLQLKRKKKWGAILLLFKLIIFSNVCFGKKINFVIFIVFKRKSILYYYYIMFSTGTPCFYPIIATFYLVQATTVSSNISQPTIQQPQSSYK